MSKRKRYSAGGMSGFSVPPQGRPAIGALPGETTEDRDKRVLDLALKNPGYRPSEVASKLGVPAGVAAKYVNMAKQMRAEAKSKPRRPQTFLPPQKFTPGAEPAATREERLAATPDHVKAEIAARYGAVFRS